MLIQYTQFSTKHNESFHTESAHRLRGSKEGAIRNFDMMLIGLRYGNFTSKVNYTVLYLRYLVLQSPIRASGQNDNISVQFAMYE